MQFLVLASSFLLPIMIYAVPVEQRSTSDYDGPCPVDLPEYDTQGVAMPGAFERECTFITCNKGRFFYLGDNPGPFVCYVKYGEEVEGNR